MNPFVILSDLLSKMPARKAAFGGKRFGPWRCIIPLWIAFSVMDAVGEGPLTTGARALDQELVRLAAGDLEVFVTTNAGGDGRSSGYNGLTGLRHKQEPTDLFVGRYSGLNFEHVFDAKRSGFAPRGGKLSLWRFGPDSVGIYRAPGDSPWGLESMTRFTLRAPHYIDVAFECLPHEKSFEGDHLGMFWASYISTAADRSIVFPGRTAEDPRAPTRWITAFSPRHDVRSTHLSASEPASWQALDRAAWPGLAKNLSPYLFDAPFYYGRSRKMVWAVLFDKACFTNGQTMRFSQSPTGGGGLSPAWDFHCLIRHCEVGKRYGWKARLVYKPFQSASDIMAEYTKWSGRTDLVTPAEEPERGEIAPPATRHMTLKSRGTKIRIDKAGARWFTLDTPLEKGPDDALGIWFDSGKGGANRYLTEQTHHVYWAVDLKEPVLGQVCQLGYYGYPIITGYRLRNGVTRSREISDQAVDGTSTGLVMDGTLHRDTEGRVTAVYWYGYEGQTIRPCILSPRPRTLPP